MNLFRNRLQQLIKQSGKTQNEICRFLNISKQKLSKWKTGYNEPNMNEIIMLAVYFEITTDYLLGLINEDGIKADIVIENHEGTNVIIKKTENGYISIGEGKTDKKQYLYEVYGIEPKSKKKP